MDWTTRRSRIYPRQRRKDISSSLCVQNSSGAHPASCTMGTGGPLPGAKARPRHNADQSPHLVPRSRMSRSYTSSPLKRLRGMEWDSFSFSFSLIMKVAKCLQRCVGVYIQRRPWVSKHITPWRQNPKFHHMFTRSRHLPLS
jgi:hypothetical protein